MADLRVHVIDDDAAIRSSTALFLRTFDYDVTEWGSPLAFLDAANPDCADCLVMDVRMPGMTGVELTEQLVARGIRIPTILVTGHASMGYPAIHFEHVVALLEKPYPAEDLLDAVEKATAA